MSQQKIIHGDCISVLPTLESSSFDSIIIDPPYGMGIDSWDSKLDIPYLTSEIGRIGRDFYAVFGQMPYLHDWHCAAMASGFHFLDHITWVKRNGGPATRLSRSHEDIYLYALGTRRQYYSRRGQYEDVKVPGILFDVITIEGIQSHISKLNKRIKGLPARTEDDRKTCHKVYKKFSALTRKEGEEFVNYTNVWSFLPENLTTMTRQEKIHCTMKPLKLMMRLVEMLTQPSMSVLDFVSGSGSTAIACKRLQRDFLGIEKDEKYYDYSLRRLVDDCYQSDIEEIV